MEWYVMLREFNGKRIVPFNIFNSAKFNDGVEKLLNDFITFDDFKEKLKNELMYAFWCKSEYEIAVGGLFSKYPAEFDKIDIYTQVLPNLDILAHYIIDFYNKCLYKCLYTENVKCLKGVDCNEKRNCNETIQ